MGLFGRPSVNNDDSGGEDENLTMSVLFQRRNSSTASSTPFDNLKNEAANASASPPHPSDDEDFVDGEYLMEDDENGSAAAFLGGITALNNVSNPQFASLRHLTGSKNKNGNF